MRVVNAFIAASGLTAIFIGMVLISAVITSAVHAQFSTRALPTIVH
jgi:hypothetical protein